MAKIIFNAALSKEDKNIASGIMLSITGKRDIGVIDTRHILYKNKSVHRCGVFWDPDKHLLQLVSDEKESNANIGVFISSYPTTVVDGKVFISEWIDVGRDIGSIAYKKEIGGYNPDYNKNEELDILAPGLIGISPKKVSLYITVGTAKEKLILKNSEGFYFVCDFKKDNWFTLKPGATELELYDYENNIEAMDLLKDKLPFPALDRKLFDEEIDKYLNGNWDLKKHALKYV